MSVDVKTRDKVIELYRRGKKTREITDATGVSRSTIYYLLQEEGVTPRRKGGIRTSERPPLSADDREKLEWAIARIAELDGAIESLRDSLRRAGGG